MGLHIKELVLVSSDPTLNVQALFSINLFIKATTKLVDPMSPLLFVSFCVHVASWPHLSVFGLWTTEWTASRNLLVIAYALEHVIGKVGQYQQPKPLTQTRLYSSCGAGESGRMCLDLPTLVSEVVAESVSSLPEVVALAAKCRTLIEAARTKNAFRTEFDAFNLRKLEQIRCLFDLLRVCEDVRAEWSLKVLKSWL